MPSEWEYEPSPHNTFGSLSKEIEACNLGNKRCIQAKPGTKQPDEEWKGDDKGHIPENVGQNSLIKCGDGLVVIDIDDWEAVPEEIQVLIGSTPTFSVQTPHSTGKEGHYYFAIDGNIPTRNPGWGEIRSEGALVVTPGSQLTECGYEDCCTPDRPGEYSIREHHDIATIKPDELPVRAEKEQTESTHYGDIDEPDEKAVETVSKAIYTFRTHTETTRRAVKYFEDLRAGRKLREHGFISSENEKGCRHEANLSLASKLHGMLLMDGETDRDRNKRLIHHYLSWVAHQDEYEWTDMGQRRKLLTSDRYIENVVNTAVGSFEHEYFEKWARKTEKYNFTGSYSKITESVVLEAVEMLVNTGDYPTNPEVVETSQFVDENPRSEGAYDKCLREMVGKKVKMAYLGGNEYRYYPFGMDDPDGAEYIKGGGWM